MRLKNKIIFKTSDIVLLLSLLVFIVTINMIIVFNINSMPILLKYAKSDITNLSTIFFNEGIKNININESVMKIDKNDKGEIINIDYNYEILNKEMISFNEKVLSSISKIEKGQIDTLNMEYFKNEDMIYYIPMGVLHGINFLTYLGPKIPIKFSMLGSINSEIMTKITAYGINNSLMEITLKVDLAILVILPFTSEKLNITKNIPIESKVIYGKIPTYYGGIINNETKSYEN